MTITQFLLRDTSGSQHANPKEIFSESEGLMRAAHVEGVIAALVVTRLRITPSSFGFGFHLLWAEPKGSNARMWH